ncbi:acyltransferase [Cryobacterium sp. TMT1-21]|uniref:acyltransferase family protein n=1 Tax=Cryobacterium sp. TMT1-21 TaxID=1259234 RepID=UPI00141ACD9F|nr:acyltransferase [Cryobacterium sp. TMT1-21]
MQNSFEDFMRVRYWPQLDGLRTISIFLVLVVHMGDSWWIPYNGALAVVLFFVISGYLITSLLIREERRNNRVSLKAFYIRRLFRIAPLYYVALAITTILAAGFGLGAGSDGFLNRLPLLATFNGDLAATGTFVHSWSIGVEEKFYILWPIVGFASIWLRNHRGLLLTWLLPIVAIAAYIPKTAYIGVYTGVIAGCLVAVALHNPRGFAVIAKFSNRTVSTLFIAIAIMAFIIDFELPASGLAHVPFAVATALSFPGIVLGNGWVAPVLTWRPLVFIGTRTYGIYLFHPLCIDVVSLVIPAGQGEGGPSLFRLAAAGLLSYCVAEILSRILEQPMIGLGRKISGRVTRPQDPSGTTDEAAALVK